MWILSFFPVLSWIGKKFFFYKRFCNYNNRGRFVCVCGIGSVRRQLGNFIKPFLASLLLFTAFHWHSLVLSNVHHFALPSLRMQTDCECYGTTSRKLFNSHHIGGINKMFILHNHLCIIYHELFYCFNS